MLIFHSCSEGKHRLDVESNSNIRAAVYLSAGDNYPLFNELGLPTFFNLGKVISSSDKDLNTIILSERIAKGSKLDIKPIALLSFEKDTLVYNYIVSVDAANVNNNIGVDHNDFLIRNYKTQSNLENWFSSQCIESPCSNFKWQSSYKALLEINHTGKK